MSIKYCEFTPQDSEAIKEVFNTIFDVKDYPKIQEVYTIFKNNFYGVPPERKETIERYKILPRGCHGVILEQFTNSQYQIGIDLPVLLQPDQVSDKTVFIIAEDPLRDFKNPQEGVVLSTPFATHLPGLRHKHLRIYWEVIQELVNHNCNVYLTDLFKLWIKQKDQEKVVFHGDLLTAFYQALEIEIASFHPQLIITYGQPACQAIQRMHLPPTIHHLAFAHPAPTANGQWKKVLQEFYNDPFIRCTIDNKIKYINIKTSEFMRTPGHSI